MTASVSGPGADTAPATAREETASRHASAGGREAGVVNKAVLLAAVAGIVVLLDFLTKQWVVETLIMHEIQPVLGEFFRLTYTHNPGAAFGINIGEHSRLFFLGLSLLALGVLGWMYRTTPRTDLLRLSALALVCGGAVGNIIDRLRYDAGVVDFIDIGLGEHRFWIFNVADSAVSVGAALLLISFYLEERGERRSRPVEGSA